NGAASAGRAHRITGGRPGAVAMGSHTQLPCHRRGGPPKTASAERRAGGPNFRSLGRFRKIEEFGPSALSLGAPSEHDYLLLNVGPMTTRASKEYRYEKLTWPEISYAVDLGKVCIVPCGSVEQHGAHLPLDVDIVCPQGVAYGAGKEVPDKMLVLPPVWYG